MVSSSGVPFNLALTKGKGVRLVPGEGEGSEGKQGLEEGGQAENPKPRFSTLTPKDGAETLQGAEGMTERHSQNRGCPVKL